MQEISKMAKCAVPCQTRGIFDSQKQQSMEGVDCSRKGSIDAPIIDLITYINHQPDHFTLSSCSGRVCVFEDNLAAASKKKGCKWLYTTHGHCDSKLVLDSLKESVGDASLKYEAFILHVQCYTMIHAQAMHATAVSAGFRNSGISVSTKGKIVVAVRSTHGLEVPLTHDGRLLVSTEYIDYLSKVANQKMEENSTRIQRFFDSLKVVCADGQGNQKDAQLVSKKHSKRKENNKHAQISGSELLVTSEQTLEVTIDDCLADLFIEQDL